MNHIKKECVAMLLAGGQGSRLYALTQEMAKPAVPYGGNCEGNEKGLATAGLVLGIVSTAVSVLMFACAICAVCAAASILAAAANG